MNRYVMDFEEIDRGSAGLVGGKAAALAEVSRIDGVNVPPGFCVTTRAFERVVAAAPALGDPLERVSRLTPDDRSQIRTVSAELRAVLEAAPIPAEIATEITGAVEARGTQHAFAVRSSATAEDLPTASFAGQQDTYLDVKGAAAVLEHVSRCWASLFTERAVAYRLRNGFDQRAVSMAVIVQEMVFPQAAGTLFTADPVSGNRKVALVEATPGLADALVSGRVRPHAEPPLTDGQLARLKQLGRRIEAHFGQPQDIEWCLVGDQFAIVQSRPITTLFPIPATDDDDNHVFVSVGHQQMMTDAMRPLGISVWQHTTPRPMREAGARLFVDVTELLASPATRDPMLDAFGRSDPLLRDALESVLERGDFIRPLPDGAPAPPPVPGSGPPVAIDPDPARVMKLIERGHSSVAAVKAEIGTKAGTELLDFILADFGELRRVLFDPRSREVYMTAMHASWWLNEQLEEWLGEKSAADTLTQSVPNNVTSEMGLALLDVADVIRPYPDVVAFLQEIEDDSFLDALPELDGGREARDAIAAWLDRYGVRCVGEIDITKPRWSERPSALVPILLANIKNFEPGEGTRRFEQGRQEAAAKEQELLERVRALPDGGAKADEVRRAIERLRTFIGYREYPKYFMIARYFVYKQALLAEAERLVDVGVLREPEDIFFLRLEELPDVVRTHEVDHELIRRRKEEFRFHEPLRPPRVLTSDGECIAGAYRRDGVPAGALAGLAVSAGTVEGRARVVLDMAAADLEPGDILVTAYTDPSWTPVFVAISALVTEVGGAMTHGAVIAREYGLPAVVGVERATQLIEDGQRIRVHGAEGYVEILD